MELKVFINDRVAIRKKVEEEINSQITQGDKLDGESHEEYIERKKLERLLGKEESEENNQDLIISLNPELIEDETAVITTADILVNAVCSVYVDEVNLIQGQKIMVVIGHEFSYDCIYEEEKYQLLKEYIKLNDRVAMGMLALQSEQLSNNLSQMAMKGVKRESGVQEKIIPMSNPDNNNN